MSIKMHVFPPPDLQAGDRLRYNDKDHLIVYVHALPDDPEVLPVQSVSCISFDEEVVHRDVWFLNGSVQFTFRSGKRLLASARMIARMDEETKRWLTLR